MNTVKKMYLTVFYNTNYVLNVGILLVLLLPLLFVGIANNTIGNSSIAGSLFIIALYSIFYNVTYITNDIIDYRKDTAQKTYKVSLFSETKTNKWGYLLYRSC